MRDGVGAEAEEEGVGGEAGAQVREGAEVLCGLELFLQRVGLLGVSFLFTG